MPVSIPENGFSHKTLHVLHLSDIHFQKERFRFNRKMIIKDALKQIKKHLAARGVQKPDLILITGDIGYKGQPNDYSEAAKFIKQVRDVVQNPKARIYVVPGNHDIDTNTIGSDSLQYGNQETWKHVMEDECESAGKVRRIRKRFENYLKFLQDVKGLLNIDFAAIDDKVFYCDSFPHHGIPVTVLGLNSAWACQGTPKDGDKNKIALGRYQIYESCEGVSDECRDDGITIALMHHPLCWMHESDGDNFRHFSINKALIFRGHTHVGEASVKGKDGGMLHEIGGSAGYIENPSNEEIGFQFVSIDPDAGEYFIWPYVLGDKGFYFPNEKLEEPDKGYISVIFRKAKLPEKLPITAPVTPSLRGRAPDPVAYFVGRLKYLEEMKTKLTSSGALGITAVAGTGGIGKTELAKKYAKDHAADYPGGVFWLDFRAGEGEVKKFEDAVSAMLRELYGKDAPTVGSPEEAHKKLLELVDGKKALVILDNVEAKEQFPPSGDYHRVITTRNRKLAGAFVGDRDQVMDLDELSEDESLELFGKIIGQSRVERGIEDAKAIARACGHLPLALEIAAQVILRDETRPLKEFIAELTAPSALDFLATDQEKDLKDLSVIRSLNMSINYIERTRPKDRESIIRLFRATSVCATAGFRAESAAAAAGLKPAGEYLTTLADLSLLKHEETPSGPMYRLHPLIHKLARLMASESKELGDYLRHYVDYFVRFTSEHRQDPSTLIGHAPEIWQALVNANQLGDMEKTRTMVAHLSQPYLDHLAKGETPSAYSYLKATDLLNIDDLGCFRELAVLLETISAPDHLSRLEAQAQAIISNKSGSCFMQLGNYERAIPSFEAALDSCRKLDHGQGQAAALGNLGNCYQIQGDIPEAIRHHQMALEIDRQIGNRLGEAQDICNLGVCYGIKKDISEAIRHLQMALPIHRQLGERLGEASILVNLGLCYQDQDDLPEAIRHLRMALEILRQIGDRLGEAQDLGNLGLCYQDKGDLSEAIRHHQMALEIDRQIGNRLGEARQLANLGICFKTLTKTDLQLACWLAAGSIFNQIGAREKAQVGGWLAKMRDELGDRKFKAMVADVESRMEELLAEAMSYKA